MNVTKSFNRIKAAAAFGSAVLMLAGVPALAQDYPPPALLAPQQLNGLVSRIALYPDPLLAQVLAASTYPDQIPEAARWAADHRYLRGDELANVMAQDNLPWDPSVQALIPFPDVLDMMARDMGWTGQLGNAVLGERGEVMDAIQRMRANAESYGYLQSNQQIVVSGDPGYIQIAPCNPGVIYVPVYDPYIVYAPPRPGFYIGSAIRFSPGFAIGFSFGNWGWGGGFNWRSHAVIVNHVDWNRNWYNRRVYTPNWGNWGGGRGRDTYVNHTTVVNRVEVNNREYVNNRYASRPESAYRNNRTEPAYRNNQAESAYRSNRAEPVYRNDNAFRNSNTYRGNPPAARNEGGNRSYSVPEARSFSRPSQPARVESPNRGMERSQSFRGSAPVHAERNAGPSNHESRGGGERGSRR